MIHMNRLSGFTPRILLTLLLLLSIGSVAANDKNKNSNQAGGLPALKEAVKQLQVDLSNVELISGTQGPTGVVGEQGAVGPTGSTTVGAQGPIGLNGPKGPDGIAIEGPEGEQGLEGVSGPQGPAAEGRSGIAWASFYGYLQNLEEESYDYGYYPSRDIKFSSFQSSQQADIDINARTVHLTDPDGIYRISWQITFFVDDNFLAECAGCEFNIEVAYSYKQWIEDNSGYVTMSGSKILIGQNEFELHAEGSYHGYDEILCEINGDCEEEEASQWHGEQQRAYPDMYVKSAFLTAQRLN
jgi:hypothetical protein